MQPQYSVLDTYAGEIQGTSNTKICLSFLRLKERQYPLTHVPLSMETLQFHRWNKRSRENAEVTAGSIDHELQRLLKASRIAAEEVMIWHSPGTQESTFPEILKKYRVVKGYTYEVLGEITAEERQTLFQETHLLKTIQYEFDFGENGVKPAFIGEVDLQEFNHANLKNAYLKFVQATGCPIIVEFMGSEAQVGRHSFIKESQQETIAGRFLLLHKLVEQCEAMGIKSLIVINLPIYLLTSQRSEEQITTSLYAKDIRRLLLSPVTSVGFNLLSYNHDQALLWEIANYVIDFPRKVILEASIRFKTDLQLYGGEGLSIYGTDCQRGMSFIKGVVCDGQKMSLVLLENKMRLISWKRKKAIVRAVVFWKCSQCKQEQREEVDGFSKFGIKFCSIACLKAFKG